MSNSKFAFKNFIIRNSYLNFKKTSLLNLNKSNFVELAIVESKIKNKINCDKLEVTDISGNCGNSFCIKIKSPDFNGKTMIMQHRMVNEALKEELKEIHALQIKSEPSDK